MFHDRCHQIAMTECDGDSMCEWFRGQIMEGTFSKKVCLNFPNNDLLSKMILLQRLLPRHHFGFREHEQWLMVQPVRDPNEIIADVASACLELRTAVAQLLLQEGLSTAANPRFEAKEDRESLEAYLYQA